MAQKGFDYEWLETLKAKNDIVSTISRYIPLTKKGRNYWGCCPFHHERTPSFSVNEMEGYFHCFGCGESGDAIKFVEKYEGLEFYEAIKVLAGFAGMEVPRFTGDEDIIKKKQQKEVITKILNDAREHYRKNLLDSDARIAQDYIKSRGLGLKELNSFEIGYSKNWSEMVKFLQGKGYTLEEMHDAGMVETKDGRTYDVFGGRLMFPIVNIYGDCIGFSGRILEKSDFAKYKNSTQTPVFDKSKTVYAINLVKKFKQEHGIDSTIIVEGQMDVIAMHKAGLCNTVACMGTALTPLHAKELKRFADKVFVCFDGDGAGQKATNRSLDILAEAGLDVKVVMLPDGKDPDEILKDRGSEGLLKIINSALPINDYKLKVIENKYDLSQPSEKAKYLKESLDVIKSLPTSSERDTYLDIVKQISGVPIDVLRRDIAFNPILQTQTNAQDDENVLVHRENGNIKALKFVLASLLFKKDYANYNYNIEKYIISPSLKSLYTQLKEAHQTGANYSVSAVFDHFDVETETQIKEIIDFNFEEIKTDLSKYFEECIWKLKEEWLIAEKDSLTAKYKTQTDLTKRKQIAQELQSVIREISAKSLKE